MSRQTVATASSEPSEEPEGLGSVGGEAIGGVVFDEVALRSAMGLFASGVVVVAAKVDDAAVGMTVQSFASLSLDPPLVMFCPSLRSTSWPSIAQAGRCALSILARCHESLARHFAVSGADKFSLGSWTSGPLTGAPILEDALGWVEAEIQDIHRGGDHYIAVARVLSVGQVRPSDSPLIFHRSEFWTVRRG